jgi:hypothetical protein
MTDDEYLAFNAQISAVSFFVEILFANLIASHDHLQTDDEHEAVAASDFAIETQRRIAHTIEKAIVRAGGKGK